MKIFRKFRGNAWAAGLLVAAWLLGSTIVHAAIEGITGTNFALTATIGNVVTSDGDSFQFWGYATPNFNGGAMCYPGPTLIVNEGDVVTVSLTNQLPAVAGNTSIVFPGHQVTATGGTLGDIAQEAALGQTVTYTFTAAHPGTYTYRSGTRPDLQVEMGLVGAIIVRPAMGANYAYNDTYTQFDREFLLVLTEMDPMVHRFAELGLMNNIDTSDMMATNWFANGRNFPDNMAEPLVPWLPNQPYNFVPRMHPGEKVLVRTVGGGNDQHPFHYHGNDFEVIAQDGRMLSSGAGMGPDMAWKATTLRSVPGNTSDIIWTWNAAQLGWDIYGHAPGDPMEPMEYAPDHGKPFPVILPQRDSLTFGNFYPGTPFLGGQGNLAPGDAGLNANAGYFYMWHSHTEKELTSNDIWPGGMVTFMIIEHPSVNLD